MFVWHFRDNYPWSFTTMGAFASVAWGGGEPGEIFEVIAALQDHIGDTDRWVAEWSRVARKAEELGRKAEESGYRRTAYLCYLRANRYYQLAERMLHHEDPRKLPLYHQSLRCFERVTELATPPIERVEIPYEGSSFPGYFLHPTGPAAVKREGPQPAVVVFDGLDATAEFMYLFLGKPLQERGFYVLLCDGPGNGAALRLRGMHSRPDYEVVGTAAFEYLLGRPEVDPERVGVAAMSLGGYYAPRIAAGEPRYRACVAYGAQYDLHETWKARLSTGSHKKIAAGPPTQAFWVFGAKDEAELLEKTKAFTLKDVLPNLKCPFLVVHGENDRQIGVDVARRLYDEAGSEDKKLVILTAEDGGDQHCQLDNLSMAHYHILDWLEDKLVRA